MIVILDFGSQTTHLIGRRLVDLGVKVKILDCDVSFSDVKNYHSDGIILSGGPASVYQPDAYSFDKRILNLGQPILGICYGWQLISYLKGGVVQSGNKEYGPAKLTITFKKSRITKGLPSSSFVWLSHGDTVYQLPNGFRVLGQTERVKFAFVADLKKNFYGVQFHPEVKHTTCGKQILRNFVEICGLKIQQRKINLDDIISEIRKQVGSHQVIGGVSGGVDSTVMAILMIKAVGKQFKPVYIESGLMRSGTSDQIKDIFEKRLMVKPAIVRAKGLFLKKLKGVTSPEKKRQIIGRLYVKLFEKKAKKFSRGNFLAQGTIYSDVIESQGTKKSSKIKSHHNVGGLPKKLNLKIIEPLRYFYKDEVRQIAKKLELPDSIVCQQPFPGPGQAIRIIGEVNYKRLSLQQKADQIVLEEIRAFGLYKKIFQSFPIMTGVKSTAVKGDARVYGEVVALRLYDSDDIMTATWSRVPYDLLQKISSRIVNEVPGISRVVYDITTKPPATMEWE